MRGEEKYESSVQQLTERKMATVPLNRHRSFKPHIIISVSVAPANVCSLRKSGRKMNTFESN